MLANEKIRKIFSWKMLAGVIIGGIAGFVYFHFWGCHGTCPITSSPVKTVIFGSIMGGLLAS